MNEPNARLDIIYKAEWQFEWRNQFEALFPKEWAEPDPEGIAKIGKALHAARVMWRTQHEIGESMHRLHGIRWIEIELNKDKTKMRFRWKPAIWV